MLLFGSLSRVLQKQRVTSPSEKCKIPPDLSTATRHTGCYICLIYILTPKENHSSSVKTASYSWYGWWIFNWPNGFCTWWVLAGSGVNLYSVQGPEPQAEFLISSFLILRLPLRPPQTAYSSLRQGVLFHAFQNRPFSLCGVPFCSSCQ